MYEIDFLIDKFMNDSKKYVSEREILKQQFIENYPYLEIPEHMKQQFNFPAAIFTLCWHIKSLEARLEILEKHLG